MGSKSAAGVRYMSSKRPNEGMLQVMDALREVVAFLSSIGFKVGPELTVTAVRRLLLVQMVVLSSSEY